MSGLVLTSCGQASPPTSEVVQKGRIFLVGFFDPDLGLLPEYHGAKVYWLFHDNYLAAKILNASHPELAKTIRSAIEREGISKSGKIEMLLGEAEKPMPFRQYDLIDVRRITNKVIRTEIVTPTILEGWAHYADLLLLASIAEKNQTVAREHWNAAMQLWDGKGFLDAAARQSRRYATIRRAFHHPAGVSSTISIRMFQPSV